MDEQTVLPFCRECGFKHGGAKWCPQCGAVQQITEPTPASSGKLEQQADQDGADTDATRTEGNESISAENLESVAERAQAPTYGQRLTRLGVRGILLLALLVGVLNVCSLLPSASQPSFQTEADRQQEEPPANTEADLRSYLKEALGKHDKYNQAVLTFTSHMEEVDSSRIADEDWVDQAVDYAQDVEDRAHDLAAIVPIPDEARTLDDVFIDMRDHATQVNSTVKAWSQNPQDASALNTVAGQASGFTASNCKTAREYQRLGAMVDMDMSALVSYTEGEC